LSGLIALVSLLGASLLPLSLISLLLSLFVPGSVGEIGPIVAVIVICHFLIPPQALFCAKGILLLAEIRGTKNYFLFVDKALSQC
jgi:hypothetical protein